MVEFSWTNRYMGIGKGRTTKGSGTVKEWAQSGVL